MFYFYVSKIIEWSGNMTEWIIPCNIKYYDVTGAFKKLKKLDWKQSNKNIETEDIVYISKICF